MNIKDKIIELVPDCNGVIGLCIVLRAIGIARHYDSSMRGSISPNGCWYENGKVMAQWNLEHDNYDQQSEECKNFIGSLLGLN